MQSLVKTRQSKVIVLIVIIILGSCLGNLSQTALNAMFSGIATDFGVDVGLGQWVTTIYMLVLGITVPVVTFLMRRFTLKHLVMGAFALLLVGSVIDVVAGDFYSLICGRVLQAVSAGITVPMMMSVIMTSFPRDRQATVMGIAGIAMGFAPNIGPTIGGWMIGVAGWRSFFVALLVCSAVLVVAAYFLIDEGEHPGHDAKLDVVSFLLSAIGFGCLLVGFSNASTYALSHVLVWLPVVVGALALAVFVKRQRRIDHPLIDMSIFSSEKYRIGFWASNFLFASFMGITLILPLYVENVMGGTALDAGLALLPGTFAAFFINPLAGWLTDRIGARPVVLVSGGFLFVGAAAMAFLSADSPFWLVVVLQGLRACGVSGLISPLTTWSMADLSHDVMTDGSSFGTAARQACASMGTALMVFVVTLGPALGSSALGYRLAFGVSALFALGLFVSVIAKVR